MNVFSVWLGVCWGLRDVRVTIPAAILRGNTAVLLCHFDLEGDSLYSVKWYKGRREFYRFTPKEDPAMKIFPFFGLDVQKIMGKTRRDRIINDRTRESLKQESVEQKLEKRQLKWFGHVVRMDERRKPKQIMEARVEGTRTRGRPRKGYMDRIDDTARKKGLEN
ncbi:hypothetical protein C0J52_10628 [Blattella germanica]|nr:hypothetical protein C0J52_10628 [Blattella germanica]